MKRNTDMVDWPPAAGDPARLPTTAEPPADLEDRVAEALRARGLIGAADTGSAGGGWQVMRVAVAMAASLALVAFGVLIGRAGSAPPGASPLTGAETNLYAVLLYETPGYDRPGAVEARTRYSEYGRWVAEARARGQFVTGEDLEVERGWLLTPDSVQPTPVATYAAAPGAPLSGIFFLRAVDPTQVLDLAAALPHLAHGGTVLVQKTIPTHTPPE